MVVLENIERHLAEGKEPHAAAREGAQQVEPGLSSTFIFTTCIVFFPVMFLFGVAKYLFGALALAVVSSMTASSGRYEHHNTALLRSLSPANADAVKHAKHPLYLRPSIASMSASPPLTSVFLKMRWTISLWSSPGLRFYSSSVSGCSAYSVPSYLRPMPEAFTINFRAPAGLVLELTTDMAHSNRGHRPQGDSARRDRHGSFEYRNCSQYLRDLLT